MRLLRDLRPHWPFACAALAAGCQTYEPEPVDLAAHAAAFAARLPSSPEVAAFAERLGRAEAERPFAFDPTDGLDRTEAQVLALLFHPELRTLRARAGIAAASA